jgi:hypothetical protein
MKNRRNGGHGPAARTREMPAPMLCAKLGEDFELFSDRTEDAVEVESLIHDFESIREAETGPGDVH